MELAELKKELFDHVDESIKANINELDVQTLNS